MINDAIIKPLSLKRNFAWTFVGNAFYAGSRWLIIMILAKLNTVELVGQYSLAIAVITPVMAFTDLQLGTVMITDVHNEKTFKEYLTLRFITTFIAIIIILGILFSTNYTMQMILVIFILVFIEQ